MRELRRELEDRFGPLPAPAEALLTIVQLKALCLDAGVESVSTVEDEFVIQLTTKAAGPRIPGRKCSPGSFSCPTTLPNSM